MDQMKFIMTVHVILLFQETNLLGFKGPRKMTVLLPGMTAEHTRVPFKPESEHDSLIGIVLSLNKTIYVYFSFFLW